MKYTLIYYLIASLLFTLNLSAQRIKIDKDALSFLASEEKINVQFSYDGLLIDNGIPEATFLENMRIKIIRQSDEKEAEAWAASYVNFKSFKWASSFTEALNKRMVKYKNSPVFQVNDTLARYTMKVNIPWMYFGYDAGIVNEPAKVNMDLEFYETKKPDKVIFATSIRRAMGKYNRVEGDGDSVGPSLNRLRKALAFGAFKLSQVLKKIVD